jgi:hypothetical protein
MGVTPRCLSLEPSLFGLYFSTLIVYHNGVIHQCLIVRVRSDLQLQPKIIIQTFEKVTLLICVISHLIRSIA